MMHRMCSEPGNESNECEDGRSHRLVVFHLMKLQKYCSHAGKKWDLAVLRNLL